MTTLEKLSALRELMHQHNLSAYIIPGTDPHASEYMAAHWEEMNWLSGFKGESGTLVVTTDTALLWTDSRYYLQAGIELEGSSIELMRSTDIDCPDIPTWLREHVQGTVGINPEMYNVIDYLFLKKILSNGGIDICSIDLIRPLWTENRPEIPQNVMYEYSEQFAGESAPHKIERIRQFMRLKGADAIIISALDEIAWLLNIRGTDIAYNPMVISYVVLELNRCTFFILPSKADDAARQYLQRIGVEIADYETIYSYLGGLSGIVLYDGKRVNQALYEAIPSTCRKVHMPSPILDAQSRKNAVEMEGERKAMIEDAIALTRFFRWLEEEAFADGKTQTEWSLMEKLHTFRAMGINFVEESFGTIAGYKGNGAIVHYSATQEQCAEVRPEGMLLLDSGGQYLDGTTDITRTVWLGGEIPEQAKLDYTYVLKGHIALQTARFPRGTRGNQLDALAKQYMWAEGITFGHGTGHGVGHFSGCHEGPQNVRTDNNPTPLEVGQIISDEPGIYRTGQWGIRTENLITVVPAERMAAATTSDEFLTFETLTLCFYDTSLIERSLMTKQEIAWLNQYHTIVYQTVAPRLSRKDAAYLRRKCRPIR